MSWEQSLLASRDILGISKYANDGGHWRRLKPGSVGKDQSGMPVEGKTWVRKSRLKKWFKPFKHQKSFINEFTSLPPEQGLIAAHGTGTGKTISSIAAFENLKEKKGVRRALVVAPAGLRTNFLESGVKKFTDSKGVIATSPNMQLGDDVEYVIVSYAAFRRNPDAYVENYKPDVMIVDEAQKLHNKQGSSYKAIREARKKIPYFMALSASPIQNDPSDIAPLLSLARPGKVDEETGKVKGRHELADRTSVNRYVKKVPIKQKGPFGGKRTQKRVVNPERLERKIGPNVHYLEDLDADKKPRKDAEQVQVRMSDVQQKYYKDAMKGLDPKLKAKIEAGEIDKMTKKELALFMVRLQYARRVSNSLHKHVPGMTLEEAAEATPKIKKVLDDAVEHLENTPDGKIIMYTNFVEGGVDVLEAGLKARGIDYGVFAGKSRKGMSEKKRQQNVEDYKSGKKRVILITSAGAEGLSLGNTTMVQMVDPHYNPEKMAQAEARGIRAKGLSHRDPKDRVVKVKRYVTTIPKSFFQKLTFRAAPKSIDEFVYMTAESKDRVNNQMRKVLQSSSDKRQKSRESIIGRMFG